MFEVLIAAEIKNLLEPAELKDLDVTWLGSDEPTPRGDWVAIVPLLNRWVGGTELKNLPRLRIVANVAVGYNNIDLVAAEMRKVLVTNTPGVLTEATADLTWALILATTRRLIEGVELVRSGRWTGWHPEQLLGLELRDRTLGLFGAGRIGQAVGRRAGSNRAQHAFARGEAIGRAVGATIVTRAQTDGWATPFTGTIPVGPGFWHSEATPPSVACGPLAGVRPWFLTSGSQFQSAPPPAFGSQAFQTALAEIRGISDTRTHVQDSIATFWAQGVGTPTPAGFWLQVATDGITQHGLSERRATHLYALLSATMADAGIGCWDTKETYWLIRPWQADPAITVVAAVGKPNHPSYPSGHSCISSSAGAVLSRFFPQQRAQLDAMVTEAGLSRMYGGIHYRFDIEAGQLLGRSVARFAIAADGSGESVLAGDDGERGDGRR